MTTNSDKKNFGLVLDGRVVADDDYNTLGNTTCIRSNLVGLLRHGTNPIYEEAPRFVGFFPKG